MNMWSALVLIVLIAVIARIAMSRRSSRPVTPAASDDDRRAMEREIVELKQRIQTLEAIATDRTRRLSDEIDALDAPEDEGKD